MILVLVVPIEAYADLFSFDNMNIYINFFSRNDFSTSIGNYP